MDSSSARTDYKFVTEPDDELKCKICLGVARDPLQHEECGKLFCKECLEKFGKGKPCPYCKDTKSNYYVDKKSQRTIQALPVKCSNVERQCMWVGTVETLQDHMDKCDKKLVPCPNPNCKLTMPRQDTEEHVRSTCPYTIISCKYESIGCDVKKKRRDMPNHEKDDKLHLHMTLDTTLQMKKDNQKLESTVADMRRDLQSTMRILQLTLAGKPIYKLTDYQKKKEDGGTFTFPEFYTNPRGYHMAFKVSANGYGTSKGSHVSVYAYILAGEYDAELKWPCLGCITFTLLNQLEDKNHHSRLLTLEHNYNARVGNKWGLSHFFPHSALGHDPVKNTQYLKNDSLYFRMSFQSAK